MKMNIRCYQKGEEQALWTLLYDTVHKINSRDYSPAQIDAWAPSDWDFSRWESRLNKTKPFVAEEDGRLIGFAELEDNGHIDCFYCAHDRQGKGVGGALLRVIESDASKQGITRLFAEVSITARGFFEKKGFSVDGVQTVFLRGEQFTNYAVSKCIADQ